ncbi:hypothetical protein [Peribacillus sp. FSL M8-0224]
MFVKTPVKETWHEEAAVSLRLAGTLTHPLYIMGRDHRNSF